jgi:hypothetical protein
MATASIKVKRSAVAGRIPATTDLQLGEIAINTYDGIAYIKKNVNGTETVVNLGGTVELSQNLQNRYQYTATSNQTTFAAVYLAPFVDVFLNGVKLVAGVDYTATNGTSIVLTAGATTGNILDIVAYTTYTANANYADLNNSHIVNALGYTPYNATNPSNYITLAQARSGISATGSLAYDSSTGVISYTTPTTTGITEGTNLYFTDARARAALSASTGISYNSTTGAISSTITQYTDALARAALSAGTGISYSSSTGAISSTITQYTDALARAAISVTGSGSYDSTTGVITVTGGVTSVNTRTGAVTLTSSDVGLGSVENKSSATIRGELTSGNVTGALGFTPENSANRGVANGYASLNSSGQIPSTQLPSYVDDVLEGANLASFPATGETGKIYVALDTNKTYRWSGSAYVYITSGAVDSVAGRTGVVTLTNTDVGLGSVENKSSATIRGEITSANVTTALGFTPYNATNPNGYITGITSSNVTTALGFTPYNDTNPSGYITSSALSSYLPLAGGTVTGALTVTGQTSLGGAAGAEGLRVLNVASATNYVQISGAVTGNPIIEATGATSILNLTLRGRGSTGGVNLGSNYGSATFFTARGVASANTVNYLQATASVTSSSPSLSSQGSDTNLDLILQPKGTGVVKAGTNTVLHADNYSSYALPLSGGTLTGITLVKRNLGTNDYASVGQHNLHLRLQRSSDLKTLELGVLDNGTGVIQANETGVGYQTLALNPVSGSVTANGSTVLHAGNYSSYALPLSGGTLTGSRPIQFDTGGGSVIIKGNSGGWGMGLYFKGTDDVIKGSFGALGGGSSFSYLWAGIDYANTWMTFTSGQINSSVALTQGNNQVLHAGNYSSYALPLSGGGLTGNLGVLRKRLTFSSVSSDANHSIYNNYDNIDGEGSFDGMKMNVYDGLRVRVGNASGATPTQILSIGSGGTTLNNSLNIISGRVTASSGGANTYGIFSGYENNNHFIGIRCVVTGTTTSPTLTGQHQTTFVEYAEANDSSGWFFKSSEPGSYLEVARITRSQMNWNGNTVLHAGNYTSYAMQGAGYSTNQNLGTGNQVTFDSVLTNNNGNGTNIRLGDDAWLGDCNTANTFRIRGVQDAAAGFIVFGSDTTQLGRTGTGALTWGGNQVIHQGNPQATTEWFHSDRDFPNGTLITTNINYAVSSGDAFVLEIRGNSYGNIVPLDLQYQGYIYYDTIINHGGLSNGLMITGLVAINNGGNLCFWFPSQGYWNGYNVKVYAAFATRAVNRVTSITNTGKPTTAKEVGLSSNIRQSLHSSNFGNYALPLSGGTVTGNTTIGRDLYINGQAGGDFGNRLIVGNNTTSYTLQDTNQRPTIHAHGAYPVISLNHTITGNSNHGPTIQFTCNGTGNQFVIGTGGSGGFLDMGYSAATDWNPHNGISGYNGTTFFRAMTNGYIGLGAPGDWGSLGNGDPSYHLHFKGTSGAGTHAAAFQNNGSSNGSGFLFQNDAGNHSWGIVTELRIAGTAGTDRPSILFSHGYNSNTWSVGFGAADDQFRINQNHGHRNGSWGTERFRIDTGGTAHFNGNVALHAGNYSSYALPLSGGTVTGTANFTNGGQCITAYGNGNTGASAGIGLNVYSPAGGNGAIMAFHRGSAYAVNMGLDSDNVMRIGGWSAAGNRWQLDMSGNGTYAGNVTAYSDERLKKDWTAIPGGFVERLAQIKSGTYTRIDSEQRQAGVSAQDFQTLLPETVSEDNSGTLSLAYGNAALVSAVELAKEVTDLRARVAQLENLISKLILKD